MDLVSPGTTPSGATAVGSLGLMLEDSETPVIWRDAYKHDYMHHLLGSFDWGVLDYLIVDMPPGTGNELITLAIDEAELAGDGFEIERTIGVDGDCGDAGGRGFDDGVAVGGS